MLQEPDRQGEPAGETPPTRAAQYIRMSTEHQQYSTENQRDAIAEYARKRRFEIVQTYADEGKSGLRIEGRDALRRLITDVQEGKCDFQAILVYDISRWGRFQDTDESAYYEYICKRAGINVYYCAEQFENDGSPTATIIKSVKRAMAGEYSRELSSKVFKGQCRLIQLGYRQGGTAGFGLRRMLVDQTGQPKGLLKRGEHKSLQTDRVVLVPGPEDELKAVQDIYRLFIHDGKRESEIAQWLQSQGIPSETGRPWTRGMVHQILTNEKYIGNNVYNHISFKLKKKRVRNGPDMWVRSEGAFDAVIDAEAFFVARGIIQERNRLFTNEEMVQKLRELFARHGGLSASIIDDADGLPSSASYRGRFGSLVDAYKLVGYVPDRDFSFVQINRHMRTLHPNLVADTVQQLQGVGASVAHNQSTDHLLINGEYKALIVLSRCRQTSTGSSRWLIRLNQESLPDITVVVRMDPANEVPEDYYLLPHIDVAVPKLLLGTCNGAYLDTYRFETLTYFLEMAVRVRIEVAA